MKVLSGLLLLSTLLITACRGQPMSTAQQAQQLDQAFHQVLERLQSTPSLRWRLCGPLPGERDYRYRHCFSELAGSADATMQEVRSAADEAGWTMTSVGDDSSELSSSYTLEGTPYSLKIDFNDSVIALVVYQEDAGFVGPRQGMDAPTHPYAVMSPSRFTQLQALSFLTANDDEMDHRNDLARVKTCGSVTEDEATSCIQGTFSAEQVRQAFASLYFAGDLEEFDRLDRAAQFRSRNEKLTAQLVEEGLMQPGEVGSRLFIKQASDTYIVTDKLDYPAYQVTYQLVSGTGGVEVRLKGQRLKSQR